MQLWMAVQMSVKMELFINVTTVAAVDLMEVTVTEVGEFKRTSAGITKNWGGSIWYAEGYGYQRNFNKQDLIQTSGSSDKTKANAKSWT